MLEDFKRDAVDSCHANGYITYQKKTRGSREGFGHFSLDAPGGILGMNAH